MGDTKEVKFFRGLKIARIVTAALTGLFFVVALFQIVIFNNIKITFQTGTDAQQLSTMKIKKGSDVELPTPLKPGAYFLGWSLSPTSGEVLENSTALMQDTTLYAVWDGAEKYAVLSVNGLIYKEVNIFDTSVEGLTPTQLNESWRVLDDYAADNLDRKPVLYGYNKTVMVDKNNNFSRFLGWQYLNVYGQYNDLLYEVDETGTGGTWTWVVRDAEGKESRTVISNANKFYPPNYRTTFTALLDYRTLNIELHDKGESNAYDILSVQLGAENVTLPVFKQQSTAHFSHWEIEVGQLKNELGYETKRPDLVAVLKKIKKRYEAGEVLESLDPLWYYFGSRLTSTDGVSSDMAGTLTLRAVYWDDETNYHYSVQKYTDMVSGTEPDNFAGNGYNDLSLENPVAYDREDNCLWLYFDNDNQILSYSFYDHNGVYHELDNANLAVTTGISIGQPVTVLGERIYFKDEWGIRIAVNYQTAATDVMVSFNYGEDLYSLPNYRHYQSASVATYLSKIGNEFVLPTGENYMKYDYIFTGWQLVGDDSNRLYCAGEKFTIPNFDSTNQDSVIEFVAVWHLQRLLFNFDFNGGAWETAEGPDFTLMKGAYGDRVRIVTDIPVKFGYDFVGWTLESNPSEPSGDELLQPGDYINVGTKIQTMYAQWHARQLRVQFFSRNDATDQWYPAKLPVSKDFRTGETLRSGGYVELEPIAKNKWYEFNGWQIGEDVWGSGTDLRLTTKVLSQLEAVTREQDDGTKILEVNIYAAQTKCTINVEEYDFMYEIADDTKVEINNIEHSKLQYVLPQGDLFYDYYPFAVAKENGSYAIFDTAGRQFISWSYTVDGSDERQAIEADTRIPAGAKKITIYGQLSEVKTITVEYYNFAGVRFQIDNQTYNYDATIDLIGLNNLGALPAEDNRLGKFVGWALEQDNVDGNPEIIYDVYYNHDPRMKLSNKVDTANTPYLIDIDRYAVQTVGLNYTLKLYAVYATNYATITYTLLADDNNPGKTNTELKCQFYINGQYEQTVLGGSTVGSDSPDFAEYGMAVLDDSTLQMYSGWNFVGWEVVLPDRENVKEEIRDYLENKIWFPGEYLPSIDFDFEFRPIRSRQSGAIQEYTVGNRVYRILSLSNAEVKIEYSGSVDVVALPRAIDDRGYAVKQGNLVINSDREVHVVVPAYSNITLEPRAIQCDTIKEFYVGENLIVSGSPVVGANFQAYRIRKGYRLMTGNGQPTAVRHASDKYDFESSMSGLLVSRDGKTLYGVPSHTSISADELFVLLGDYQMNRIAGYALSDINNMPTINLAKNQDLQIDANAIFNGTVTHIILPANDDAGMNLQVSPQAISGALRNLMSVTFGDEKTIKTRYAFIDSCFVYYIDNYVSASEAKTHVMYVLPSAALASLTPLTYTTRNLPLENTVTKVEPYALAGCDWTKINSVMVENKNVDLRNLQGIPDRIPLFTTADNPNKGPMIQPYEKTFVFTCNNSESGHTREEVKFKYGQTFTVFNAQKKNYNFYFDKTWSQFVGWFFEGKMFRVGEVYKVGISDDIIGDRYTLQFDASSSNSWTEYPVRFYIYNGEKEVPYTPEVFYDSDKNDYVMDELLTYYNYLDDIYLPGLDQGFNTADGSRYQFIGWVSDNNRPAPNSLHLWNNENLLPYRILPNRTANTELTAGHANRVNGINIYTYYALYEKVTPDLDYELLSDDTFSVTKSIYTNMTSLNIPFARYYESDKYPGGYMLPISKIVNFGGIVNTLNEISIGGAVSEICENAFSGVSAKKITFNQHGRGIYYNYYQSTPVRQLTIGKYAFASNFAVEKLTLPASLESLGDGAFLTCINLVDVAFEDGYVPALRSLGDRVFCNNYNMTDNAVVRLLTEDGKNGDNRFIKVGAGIFMHTNITDVRTSDGRQTNKIVWRDTLLHVFYLNGYPDINNLTFTEKEIAGYAFADLGSDGVNITIRFGNSNTVIHAYAFSNLHTSVNKIYLYDRQQSLKPANVDKTAFDKNVSHTVDVYTANLNTWNSAGFGNVGGFRFSR